MILRIVLRQRGALSGWRGRRGATSALTRVECFRTLDRFRLVSGATDTEVGAAREAVFDALSRLETIEVTPTVLLRAAEPLPVQLGTLDAIHLASALLWRESIAERITFATHDRALALAARSVGFEVAG